MRLAIKTTSVMTAPASTTNMTGFLTIKRGSSFQNESTMALRRILRSPNEVPFACGFGVMGSSKGLSGVHQQVIENRPQAERREKSERADDDDHGNKKNGEERPGNREGAQRFRNLLFRGKISRDGQDGNNREEAPEEHHHSQRRVVPQCVRIDPSERGAVVAGAGSVRIENLRKAVRARIADAGESGLGDNGDCREDEDGERGDQDGKHRHLYAEGFNLLAEELRRA